MASAPNTSMRASRFSTPGLEMTPSKTYGSLRCISGTVAANAMRTPAPIQRTVALMRLPSRVDPGV